MLACATKTVSISQHDRAKHSVQFLHGVFGVKVTKKCSRQCQKFFFARHKVCDHSGDSSWFELQSACQFRL